MDGLSASMVGCLLVRVGDIDWCRGRISGPRATFRVVGVCSDDQKPLGIIRSAQSL